MVEGDTDRVRSDDRPGKLTPAERSLRSRLGALKVHSTGRTNTAPARAAMTQRFLDEVDPEGVLPPAERARRAEYARRAHMTKLSLKASQARRKGRLASS